MITDDKHWDILISHVLQMKRRDWTNSSDFVTIEIVIWSCFLLAQIYITLWKLVNLLMEIQEISTSLLKCVRTDDVDGARRLLVGVDEKDRKLIVAKRDNSDPPLFVAAMRGNVDMVTFLAKECSADLEERGTFFNDDLAELVTPLWCAVVSNRFEAVKRLIELGADVDAVSDSENNSVLGTCTMNGNFLRGHFANMNNIVTKDEDIVQLLIDHGSDPFMRKQIRWRCISHSEL